MENLADYQEIVEVIRAGGGEAFKRCFQCGLCDAVCPWNRFRPFSMRRIVREAAFGLTDIESEDLWRCTTCGLCPQQCPRDVRQIDSGTALRRIATEYGVFPPTARPIRGVRGSLMAEGNPLNEPRSRRSAWAEGLGVPSFTEGVEYLYFPGCYLCYDPRLKKVARATARLLLRAGVDFGILGEQENCCGESIRKAGDEEAFKRLARENIKAFIDHGVKKILVSSPHCYHTFKNEYAEFRVAFEVVHIARLLADLLAAGRLAFGNGRGQTVAFHDPCYLGRHNGLYEEPRAVLGRIPGVTVVELPESRADSLCCGGGGGRIWMETPRGERFSDLRLAQAVEAGAHVLVTSCPYCIANFEDSRLNTGLEARIEIQDLTEVAAAALQD
ncbi:MAG: (Fe-S)-binding protein [Desulfobacterales bacterium]